MDHIVDVLPVSEESAPASLFRRPSELGGTSGTEWVVPGLVARGNVTELTGKVKMSGKTTFALTLVHAVLSDGEFIGKKCERLPIVYLTEQSDSSFRAGLDRAGLLEFPDVHVMSWHQARKLTWAKTVAAAANYANGVSAGLIIVDTIGRWTGASGDQENSAGAAGDAMEPLKLASAQHNLAILTLRHGRKSGGEVGDDGRGSSAFSDDADILLSLRRPEGNHSSRPNVRELVGVGRFDDIPDRLMIELQGRQYVAIGTESAVATQDVENALRRAMPRSPATAITEGAIIDATGGSRSVGRRLLQNLVKAGEVGRIGEGRRGDPFRYHWAERKTETNSDGFDGEKLCDQTLKGKGMNTNNTGPGPRPTEPFLTKHAHTGKTFGQKGYESTIGVTS